MMTLRIIILVLSVAWLQACSSVQGPVHFYSGQARPASETARVQVPAPITVVKIDDQDVDVPSNNEGIYEIYLLPGVHRIDFKYELSWGDEVSGMLVTSDVVGIESQFFAGKHYELTYPVPTEQEEAYYMALKFQAQLLEKETGRQIASRPVSELNEFRRSASVLPVSRNTAQLSAAQLPSIDTFGMSTTRKNKTDTVATDTTVDGVSVPEDIKEEDAVREDTVKRLKFWWLIASKDERQQFRKWMKSVEGAVSEK